MEPSRPLRVLLCTGGSVGHLAPAVAAWRALERLAPGSSSRCVCTERAEDAEFLRFEDVDAVPVPWPRRSWRFPLQFLSAYRKSARVLDAWAPDVVLSKGGAVSVPACLAARKRGIPIVLHESDAVSGYANRVVARWAAAVCLGFPADPLPPRAAVTGNPVRPEVTTGNRDEGLRIAGFDGKKPILLVLGGSQGARDVNRIVLDLLPRISPLADVLHLTGKGKRERGPGPGYFPLEFAYAELPHFYAAATLALSRAGAGSISELAAAGLPGILTPLRGLAQDHQEHNARAAEAAGAFLRIEQSDLPSVLVPTLERLLSTPPDRNATRTKMGALHRPDAAEAIARAVIEAVEASGKRS